MSKYFVCIKYTDNVKIISDDKFGNFPIGENYVEHIVFDPTDVYARVNTDMTVEFIKIGTYPWEQLNNE